MAHLHKRFPRRTRCFLGRRGRALGEQEVLEVYSALLEAVARLCVLLHEHLDLFPARFGACEKLEHSLELVFVDAASCVPVDLSQRSSDLDALVLTLEDLSVLDELLEHGSGDLVALEVHLRDVPRVLGHGRDDGELRSCVDL